MINIAQEQWKGSTWEVGETLMQHSVLAPYNSPEPYLKNLLLIPELFNALLKNIASRQRKLPDFSYLLWPLLFLSTRRIQWFFSCFSVNTLGLWHVPGNYLSQCAIASGVLLVNGKQRREVKQDVLSSPAGHVHKTEAENTDFTLCKWSPEGRRHWRSPVCNGGLCLTSEQLR